ncbi:MAG: hemolysin family protein [Candidatus Eisenbacteria bacterium]
MDPILLTLMLVLLALSAFFSATEAAFFSLTRLQLHQLEERRDRASRRILRLLEDPEQILSALLVGNNLVNIALSSITTAFFLDLITDRGAAVRTAFFVALLAVLVFGEITPKTIAVNYALPLARFFSGGLSLTSRLLRPMAAALRHLARGALSLVGHPARAPVASRLISQAELRSMLEDVEGSNAVITRSESRLVQNILDFATRTAEEIMTPRVDIIDLDVATDAASAVRMMRETRHSRYPVWERDPDNVIGFVQAKEFLLDPERGLAEYARPVAFFPEVAPVDRIFQEIRRSRTGLVIVVDEHGQTVGLITREDVVEEIVGDIYDEFDQEEPAIRKKAEGLYILPGRLPLQDLNESLGLTLPDQAAVTVNGFVCDVHGHIPRPGTVVEWQELRFHVLEVARHQVRRVLLELPSAQEEQP